MSTPRQLPAISDPLDREGLIMRGSRVRQGREILNNCWYINRDLRDDLWGWVESRNLPGYPEEYVETIRYTVTDRHQTAKHTKHYATVVDARLVTDELATDGYILIDAALDQFSDWYHERDVVPFTLGSRQSIASVAITAPGVEFRMQVYHEMFDVDPENDVEPALPI